MKRRRAWLELAVIVVGIALLAAWMRPRVEEPQPRPSPQPASKNSKGLRLLGKNAQGFEEYENPRDGTVLIYIPGGTLHGSDDGPPFDANLPPYFLARTPVTNVQFARFVSATTLDAGSSWKQFASKCGPEAPVTCLTREEASAYCKWAGLRLPTWPEWALACRGTEGFAFPWGNKWDATRCQVLDIDKPAILVPVGTYPMGASPFGCLDMVGSVWQWTSHDDLWPSGRVLCGGTWSHNKPTYFRRLRHIIDASGFHILNHGFRCALTP